MDLFDMVLSAKVFGKGGAVSAIGAICMCVDETYAGAYITVGSMVIE